LSSRSSIAPGWIPLYFSNCGFIIQM
jgi:hypothetical protein